MSISRPGTIGSMELKIKRLYPQEAAMRGYHLFDGEGALVMVAEHGTPWLPEKDQHLVRFAYPNAQAVASMDLSGVPTPSKHGLERTSYAIIYDLAVYAIISEYRQPDGAVNQGGIPPHYVLEVDGCRCLLVERPSTEAHDKRFALYESVSVDALVVDAADNDSLPAALGQIATPAAMHDFQVSLPDGRLRQPSLVALALTFLVDRHLLPRQD